MKSKHSALNTLATTIMDQYLEATTVHGFRYVHSSSNICQRVIWVLIICGGFSTAAMMIHNVMISWSESPVITTIDSISAPIKLVQFPTVTVCPDPKQPADNWGYLEKLLNAVEFTCFGDEACQRTSKVRKDIAEGVTSGLFKKVLKMRFDNPLSPIWYSNQENGANNVIWYSMVIVETINHLINKKFSLGTISESTVQNVLKGKSFNHVLEELADYSECDLFCAAPECNKACEGQRTVTTSYIDVSELLLSSQYDIPLGVYLSNFANLTGNPLWSSLDESKVSSIKFDCSKITSNEKELHKIFALLGQALGFEQSELASLFDIPSIFGGKKEEYEQKKAMQMFINSQCETIARNSSFLGFNSNCFSGIWGFVLSHYNCKPGEQVDICCNYWSKWIGHKLEPLMKIMRMAVGRGQSHFNTTDFLAPFKNNSFLKKYSMINYTNDFQFDMTSYLPYCSFIESPNKPFECNIFQPVPTDLGMCYAFNGELALNFLKESTYKKAFHEAYGSELQDNLILKGQGSGPKNALDFFIDNSKLKKKTPTKDFLVGITSANQYFDMNSIAKTARPGYIKIFDLAPVEVAATEALKELPLSQRKCKFPHEAEESQLFAKYSQSSCELECRIQFALDQCDCIPWDIPRFEGVQPICDLFGSTCFYSALNLNEGHDCHCPPDCNDIRFTVNEKEFKTDVADYCSEENGIGHKLTSIKLNYGYDGLIDRYNSYYESGNSSRIEGSSGTLFSPRKKKLCKQLFETNIAIVSVRFETKKYMRSIKDKKVSFGDKLAAFGGTLGLFTGMSILSMVEMVFWTIKLVPTIFLKDK